MSAIDKAGSDLRGDREADKNRGAEFFPHFYEFERAARSCRNPAQSAEWRRRRVEGRHQVPHQEQVWQEGVQYDATKDKQHELRQVDRREGVQDRPRDG